MRATKRDKSLPTSARALSPEQLNAVDRLAVGTTDSAVAEAVGVHRVTVTRWRTSPTFLAALNCRRADLFAGATDQLRDLIPKALTAIGEALAGDDEERKLSAAFELLKAAKLTAGGCIGSTDHRQLVDAELAALPASQRAALAALLAPSIPVADTRPSVPPAVPDDRCPLDTRGKG